MFDNLYDYYENYDEDGRLMSDKAHQIEYYTTIRYFDKLFSGKLKILDACAGTGRYAFYLANKGHSVTALDLVPHNVEIIKSKADASELEEIKVCDVLDLSGFEDESFDVVLCMGALYHLKDEDRKKAVEECRRLLKKGGIIALAYISKYGCIAANAPVGLADIEIALSIYNETTDDIFTLTSPEKIVAMAEESGIETLHIVGTDGIAYVIADKINPAPDENFSKWLEYHYLTCEEPGILGYSMHGLYIGRKK